MLSVACSSSKNNKAPVELTWINGGYDEGKKLYLNEFIIKNLSESEIGADWVIYYSQMPKSIVNVESTPVNVEVVNANYFRMYPTQYYSNIGPNDSLIVTFYTKSNTINLSKQPEGCYWVSRHDSVIYPLSLKFASLSDEERMQAVSAEKVFDKNDVLETSLTLDGSDVLPAVKRIDKKGSDVLSIASEISLSYSDELSNEADILKNKLELLYGIKVVENSPIKIKLQLSAVEGLKDTPELYKLEVGKDNECPQTSN